MTTSVEYDEDFEVLTYKDEEQEITIEGVFAAMMWMDIEKVLKQITESDEE